MKFNKPVVIEAVHYTGDNLTEILAFDDRIQWSDFLGLGIGTLEGMMTANVGDWIIKGVAGEVYPCKPGIFDATYEPVSEGAR